MGARQLPPGLPTWCALDRGALALLEHRRPEELHVDACKMVGQAAVSSLPHRHNCAEASKLTAAHGASPLTNPLTLRVVFTDHPHDGYAAGSGHTHCLDNFRQAPHGTFDAEHRIRQAEVILHETLHTDAHHSAEDTQRQTKGRGSSVVKAGAVAAVGGGSSPGNWTRCCSPADTTEDRIA